MMLKVKMDFMVKAGHLTLNQPVLGCYVRFKLLSSFIMNSVISQPYTIIESAPGKKDKYFLLYGSESLKIGATDYAILQYLLSDGFDAEAVSEERQALNARLLPYMSDNTITVSIQKLRRKVEDKFPGLVIPRACSHAGSKRRLLTRTEIDSIQEKISNPGKESFCVFDERGVRRLFVNGAEIRPSECLGIDHPSFVLFSLLTWNAISGNRESINSRSRQFQIAWRQLTGREMNQNLLSVRMARLRKALRPAGLTITNLNTKVERGDSYRLIPLAPA